VGDSHWVTRRDFLGAAAVTSASLLTPRNAASATRIVQAPGGRPLEAGLIGCGGRGRGAAVNFLDAAPQVKVTALADVFDDRISEARQLLAKRGQEIPEARCFVGFDAYEKLLESGVDVVLQATPPHFRPAHFAAAVAAGKHCFLEKPLAVDATGVRSVMETAERAASRGLSVMTGTQMRRDRVRVETRQRVLDGQIGDIVALRAFRNQGALWHREREAGWSDMEAMIRDWVNWTWLSGDCLVEQFIHHIDQVLWVMGTPAMRAVGMGGRARRQTGDQYDFFSIDYTHENGVHLHATIRQIDGCANEQEEVIVGTRGIAELGTGVIRDLSGREIWQFRGEKNDPLIQEHADWIAAIRADKPVNQAKDTAVATLLTIIGRDSAYTGQAVAYDEALKVEDRLGPTEYAFGPVDIKPTVPVPGSEARTDD
jgi:myo-inositol 2-dehydrogenase/D-chiro-inositol 1-dehydrogenase